MRAAKIASMLPFLVALSLLTAPAAAQDQPKAWLKGLDAAKVTISVSQALVDAGMPGTKLRTQTELQLRRAGLRIDPSLEGTDFNVEITGCQGPGTNVYACVVSITVRDTVKVLRNEEAIYTPIWGPDLYVLYLPNGVAQPLLETTQARVDVFLNDWLAANPR